MIAHAARLAWKMALRRPLYTGVSLACIVLTLVVLVVCSAIIQHAFWPDGVEKRSDRFAQVGFIHKVSATTQGSHTNYLGIRLIDQYLRPLKSAEAVAALSMPQLVSVYQPGRLTQLDQRYTDAQYWRVLDFPVLAGRVYTDDDMAAARNVVVLNASSARRLFPGPLSSVPGQRLSVGGIPHTVIGVVADAFHINAYADMWVPLSTMPAYSNRSELTGSLMALLLARDRKGLDAVQAELRQVEARLMTEEPGKWKTIQIWADSKLEHFARNLFMGAGEIKDITARVLAGIAAGALVLMLLPALNLLNLNNGRIAERATEIGVRKAFGASDTQLAGQFLVEHVLLCLAGGVVSLLLSAALLRGISAAGWIPYLDLRINWIVLLAGLALTLVFAMLSGVFPAWLMARAVPASVLKGGA
jgi:putative ABC transport system permease protein